MIKVLHVMSSLGGGGVERMLYNYYMHMDRSKIHFDFVVHGKKIGILEEPLKKIGSEIYHVTPKKDSLYKNCLEIHKALGNEKYDAVIVHQGLSSFSALALAFFCGVKTRIIHSHGYIPNENKSLIKSVCRLLNHIFATDYAACSPEAAEWLFGKKKDKERIVYNPVDEKKFRYDEKKRNDTRKKIKISDDDIFLLQAGRISEDKNPDLTMDIFSKLKDDSFFLAFAGDGDYENVIKRRAHVSDKKDRIVFLGCVNNIEDYMNAADVLLFPTKQEGFGMVAVEAQMCGLPVLASDIIPKSTRISDKIIYLPIESETKWIDALNKMVFSKKRESIYDERFDASKQASHYEKYLTETINKNKRDKVQ